MSCYLFLFSLAVKGITSRDVRGLWILWTIDKQYTVPKWAKWIVFVIKLNLLLSCFGLPALYVQ